jgi:hypothetical protein
MRTALAVVLCSFLGGCATSGEGVFHPYGIYDVVSADGQDWTRNDGLNGWWELRPDGTSTLTLDIAAQPYLEPFHVEFSLGEMEDGCVLFVARGPTASEEWSAHICGEVFTIRGPGQIMVLRKRR